MHRGRIEEAPGVTSVTSGYMQGAETIQVTFDPRKPAMTNCSFYSGRLMIRPRSIARAPT